MTTPAQGMMDDICHAGRASRLLVVDDEEIIRALLSEILAEEGFDVTTASDGKEAIELLNSEHFDLVISDMVMPVVGGIEVLQEAFRIDPDYAVIIITGYPSVDTAVKLVNLGAADYITKPFNVDIIKITVAKVLEMKKIRGGPPESESTTETSGQDAETGVYSRSIFFQLLTNEVGSAKLRNQACSLLAITLDGLSGAQTGQNSEDAGQIVKAVADFLNRQVRPGDTIGRINKAEFAVILPQTDRHEAGLLAERMQQAGYDGYSITDGVACYPQDANDAKSLLLAARAASKAAIT